MRRGKRSFERVIGVADVHSHGHIYTRSLLATITSTAGVEDGVKLRILCDSRLTCAVVSEGLQS
jgi:hypothetical protein